MKNLYILGLIGICTLSSQGVQANAIWPNSSGPCSGSLNACVSSVSANETVTILSNAGNARVVDEDVNISKPVTLQGAAGSDIVFAPNRHISIALTEFSATSNHVVLQNFSMYQGSIDIIDQNTSGQPSLIYDINHIHLLGVNLSPPPGAVCSIYVNKLPPASSGSGSFFTFTDNVVDLRRAAVDFGGICFDASGTGTVSANDGIVIERNQIYRSANPTSSLYNNGIYVFLSNTINSTTGSTQNAVQIFANTVLGPFSKGIETLVYNHGHSASVDIMSNFVNGQVDNGIGAAALMVATESSSIFFRLNNNTLTDNFTGIELLNYTTGAASSVGFVNNNLIAFNDNGVLVSGNFLLSNAYNLMYNTGGTSGFTPAGSTITADPQLESHTFPALRAAHALGETSSPAIDAGRSSDVPSYYAWDITGEARNIGGSVDIGAFEYTLDVAQVIEANSGNAFGNTVQINTAPVPLRSDEYIVATPILSQASLAAQTARTLGVFQFSPTNWELFNENSAAAMGFGQKFSVLVPYGNASISGMFAVGKYGLRITDNYSVSTASDPFTTVLDSRLNDQPDAIAVALARYENPMGSVPASSYHDHRLGMEYGVQHGPFGDVHVWNLIDQDNTPMVDSTNSVKSFNVTIAPLGSPNAFRTSPSIAPVSEIRLDNPLLNDNRCAAVTVGRNNTTATSPPFTFNDVPFALQYRTTGLYGSYGANGHWYIVPVGGSASFPPNAAFNVIVDGTQASRCLAQVRTDELFVSGLE